MSLKEKNENKLTYSQNFVRNTSFGVFTLFFMFSLILPFNKAKRHFKAIKKKCVT